MTLAVCTLHPSSLSAHPLPLQTMLMASREVGLAVPTGSSHSSSCHHFLAGVWTRGLPLRQILSLEREPRRLSLVSVLSRPIICGQGAEVTLVLHSMALLSQEWFLAHVVQQMLCVPQHIKCLSTAFEPPRVTRLPWAAGPGLWVLGKTSGALQSLLISCAFPVSPSATSGGICEMRRFL